MIEENLFHNKLELYVPKKISNFCLISSHLFLILAILFKNNIIFSFLLFLLYLSSIHHWNYLYIKSTYRTIDKIIVILTVIYSIIYIFNFNKIYLSLIFISAMIWYFNELIYFYEVELVKKYYDADELKKRKTVPEIGPIMKKYPKKWNFSKFNKYINMSYLTFYIINFFDIKPTYNKTKERIYAYYKTTFIHLIFNHLLPFVILIHKLYN